VKIAFTVNGPGEYAGWLRPLLSSLYARDPSLEASVFFVPDDFATGREPAVARAEFPALQIFRPYEYIRFALGGKVEGMPRTVDRVQYLGGDLMHAAHVGKRLRAETTSYKFSRPGYRKRFARVFAVDERNRAQLIDWKTPPDRIQIVGNLAIDAAFREAEGADEPAGAFVQDGILIMPGSRRAEIANLVPFFLRVALRIRETDPEIPIAFALSPFTTTEEVAQALAKGGLPTVYGARGHIAERDGIMFLQSEDRNQEFAVVRSAMRAATRARLVLTIPGTKTIELAALGAPIVAAVPFNAPEAAVINGPLQYVERVPFIGTPLKRQLVLQYTKRFTFFTQPNMDAERELIPELTGTLTPGFVAQRTLERYNDAAWRASTSEALRTLYTGHRGASQRMAEALAA
jgi:lipid A disaccharide synthetase